MEDGGWSPHTEEEEEEERATIYTIALLCSRTIGWCVYIGIGESVYNIRSRGETRTL